MANSILWLFRKKVHAMAGRIVILLLVISLTACGKTLSETPVVVPTAANVEPTPDSKNPILHISNGEWAPYTGKNLAGYGCDSMVVSEVFNQMDIAVVYGFFPWARALEVAKIGEYDGTMEWDNTLKFQRDFYISFDSITEQEWVFFFRLDHPLKWNSIDDLAGKKIGTTSGYLYSDAFSKQLNDTRFIFEPASSDEANFRKLLSGRIDVFPMERNVGNAILLRKFSTEEIRQITYDPKPISTFRPHLLLNRVRPENQELISKFDQNLKLMKASPRYLEITKNCVQ
ncbi:MAG TPA: transporter substrate-binding domain-containing protein [Leptolinea sp.]